MGLVTWSSARRSDAPVRAVDERYAQDEMVGVGTNGRFLAHEFSCSIPVDRVGAIPLDIWSIRGSVENVVGADMDDLGGNCAGGMGNVARPEDIDAVRRIPVGLAQIDIRKRGAVDDDGRLQLTDLPLDSKTVGDVQIVMRQTRTSVKSAQPVHEFLAKTPSGADDKNRHNRTEQLAVTRLVIEML